MRFMPLLVVWSLLTYAACQSTHRSTAVDRRDPEAVLRAYFAAWANNDRATLTSLMAQKYADLAYEPVDSLRVLTIVPADGASPTRRVYAVSFEVTFKGGRSISMESGRYRWTYTLTWDATHASWLISNYGAPDEGRNLPSDLYSAFILTRLRLNPFARNDQLLNRHIVSFCVQGRACVFDNG